MDFVNERALAIVHSLCGRLRLPQVKNRSLSHFIVDLVALKAT